MADMKTFFFICCKSNSNKELNGHLHCVVPADSKDLPERRPRLAPDALVHEAAQVVGHLIDRVPLHNADQEMRQNNYQNCIIYSVMSLSG
jgi:hypothetical protein